MRHLLIPLCLLSAPVLAGETKSWKGEGFTLEASSPALPVIKFRGPKGGEVSLWYMGGLGGTTRVSLASCTVPCEKVPKDNSDWKQVNWSLSINGGVWAKGVISPQHRTAYVVTVEDPNETPAGDTASAPAPSTPAPSAPAPTPESKPAPTAPAPVVTAPSPSKPSGMDAPSFQRLRGAIEKERIASSRMSVLKMGLRDARLSVAQVGTLVDLFTFSDDKVNVVRLTRAGLVDPQNGFELLQHFTFATDKETVRELLEGSSEEGEREGGRRMNAHGPAAPMMPEMPRMPSMPQAPEMPEDMTAEDVE